MSGFLSPDPRLRELSDLGLVQAGALLHTYVSGTPSTPLATYTTDALSVANANPIVASAGGLFPPIYLTPGVAYKYVLTDALGNALWQQDPVGGPSAGLTAPILVTQGGTGIIVGVSGAIPFFSSTTTIASSALLAAHGVVIGGGAGVAPLTTGAGTAGQVLTSNGAAADPTYQNVSTVLDRDVTVTDVTNTVAETTVYTFSVPGGTLGANKTLRISLIADVLDNAGAGRTFTVRLKFGATTVFTTATNFVVANSGANRGAVVATFELVGLNATNAQAAKGWLTFGDTSTNNATGTLVPPPNASSHLFGTNAAVAEDSTVAKTLAITFQISSAEVTSSIRCLTVLVELV